MKNRKMEIKKKRLETFSCLFHFSIQKNFFIEKYYSIESSTESNFI